MEQNARGLSGILAFEQVAEKAADDEGRDRRHRRDDVPHRADLARHRMLLAHRRSQSILCACNKEERYRQQQDRNKETDICHRGEGKVDIQSCCECAEQQHEASVSHPEGTPSVANESENKRQVEGDASKHAEIGEFMCLQIQSILKKEAYWNVDQTTVRRAEGQQHDQDAEVEKNSPSRRVR